MFATGRFSHQSTGPCKCRSSSPASHDPLTNACIVACPSSVVRVPAADGAWSNRLDGTSTRGHLTMAAHPNVFEGRDRACVCVPLDVADIPVSGAKFPVCGWCSTEPEHADLLRVARGRIMRRRGESRSVRIPLASHGRDLCQRLHESCRCSSQYQCSCSLRLVQETLCWRIRALKKAWRTVWRMLLAPARPKQRRVN